MFCLDYRFSSKALPDEFLELALPSIITMPGAHTHPVVLVIAAFPTLLAGKHL